VPNPPGDPEFRCI